MKTTTKLLMMITPLALLASGCNAPVRHDTTISNWVRDGELPPYPPGGISGEHAYLATLNYPLNNEPSIVVEADRDQIRASDMALAKAIRRHVEYDRGLAPSLVGVSIRVQNDVVILQGAVRSDFDARIIVDDLREVPGVTLVENDLAVNPI